MVITTNKQTLSINQVIAQKTETIIVEEEFVVPDIKPDILSTISTSGTVCIYKKEISTGNIKVDGCVNTYVIYLADDEMGAVRSLNATLDFSKTIDVDNVSAGMILENKVTLKSVECRVLNGRKVSIKAIIELELNIVSNENIEFVNEIEDIKDVQLLNKTLTLNSMLGTGVTKVYAKDTIVIDSVDNLAEIMKVEFSIINEETKVSYNKVLVKADAVIKIMYLTEDNRICTTSGLIPIMGFIDMPNVSDENLCDIWFELKNLIVKPNSVEEHSIYVEGEVEINCNVSESKEMNIIQDLYSPEVDLTYKQEQIKAISQKNIVKDICNIREKQFIADIGNHKLYDAEIKPSIINKNILKDKIIYEGQLEINFIFDAENVSRVDTKNVIIPFTYTMDCAGVTPSSEVETSIEITTQDFTIIPDGGIDIKVDLKFGVKLSNNQMLQVIEEISVDESRNAQRCSLVIYFVKPGDTLWKIAKKFRSTIADIAKINELEDENNINIGQQLFIPNYCSSR